MFAVYLRKHRCNDVAALGWLAVCGDVQLATNRAKLPGGGRDRQNNTLSDWCELIYYDKMIGLKVHMTTSKPSKRIPDFSVESLTSKYLEMQHSTRKQHPQELPVHVLALQQYSQYYCT